MWVTLLQPECWWRGTFFYSVEFVSSQTLELKSEAKTVSERLRRSGFWGSFQCFGIAQWVSGVGSGRVQSPVYLAKISEGDFPGNPFTIDSSRYKRPSLIIYQSCPVASSKLSVHTNSENPFNRTWACSEQSVCGMTLVKFRRCPARRWVMCWE